MFKELLLDCEYSATGTDVRRDYSQRWDQVTRFEPMPADPKRVRECCALIMNKRPLSVTLLSLLILATGVFGLVYHSTELNLRHPFQTDVLLLCLLRVLAIVAGVFMLRGANWARWLTLAWIALHVVISAFHSMSQVAAHGVLLAVYAFFLLRPPAAQYFRRSTTEAA